MNTPPIPKASSQKPTKSVNRWHRTTGVTVAAVLIYLLATGVPLQFSDQLDLAASHVAQEALLDWYGLEAPRGVVVSGGLSYLDGMLFDDGVYIGPIQRLVGAVQTEAVSLAADAQAVWLVALNGERLNEATVIGNIERIGMTSSGAVLEAGGTYLEPDADYANWSPVPEAPGNVRWSVVEPASEHREAETRGLFLRRMLTWERVLQDLHSGRFFGVVGIVVVDLATLLLLILAATGLVIWWRSRNTAQIRNFGA